MFTSLHDDYTKWGYVFPPRSCRYWLTVMGAVCAAPILRTRDAGLCFVTSLCKDTNVTNTVFTRQWLLCTRLHLPCLEVDPLIDIMDIIDICRVRQRRGMKKEREREKDEAFWGSYVKETCAAKAMHEVFVLKRFTWFVTRWTNRNPRVVHNEHCSSGTVLITFIFKECVWAVSWLNAVLLNTRFNRMS